MLKQKIKRILDCQTEQMKSPNILPLWCVLQYVTSLCYCFNIVYIQAGRSTGQCRLRMPAIPHFTQSNPTLKCEYYKEQFGEQTENTGSCCPACWHGWAQWRLPAISWFQKASLTATVVCSLTGKLAAAQNRLQMLAEESGLAKFLIRLIFMRLPSLLFWL